MVYRVLPYCGAVVLVLSMCCCCCAVAPSCRCTVVCTVERLVLLLWMLPYRLLMGGAAFVAVAVLLPGSTQGPPQGPLRVLLGHCFKFPGPMVFVHVRIDHTHTQCTQQYSGTTAQQHNNNNTSRAQVQQLHSTAARDDNIDSTAAAIYS